MRKSLFLLFLTALAYFFSSSICFCSNGQEKNKTEAKKTSLVVLPVIFYTPETRWAAGAGGLYAFRLGKSEITTRPSSLLFDFIYTQNKQFVIEFMPELYLKEEKYFLTSYLSSQKFPEKFYGIGNNTPESVAEDYTPRTVSIEFSFQKKIWPKEKIYAGLQYKFQDFKILKFEKEDGMLARGEISGTKGGKISGAGFILKLDSRDNIFYPTRGDYFELSTNFYGQALASDYSFVRVDVDLRKYIPLFSSHVLALQAFMQSASGSSPFYMLSKLGGQSTMRGYYSGRYRDKILVAFQVEYRLPIWRRIGMVCFAGWGDVADKFNHFKLEDFKYSLGWGLRYKIIRKEGTNLRLDFGYGQGCSGIYFTAGEAF